MTQTISATDVRNNFAEIINRVQYGDEQFVIEKQGKPVAKITPPDVRLKKKVVLSVPVFAMGGAKKKYSREDMYE